MAKPNATESSARAESSSQPTGSGNVKPTLLLFGALSVAMAWSYVSAIFVLNKAFIPINFGAASWYASIGIVVLLSFFALKALINGGVLAKAGLQNLSILVASTVFSALALDVLYTINLNAKAPSEAAGLDRKYDPHTWIGELYPKLYFPTERNFRVHKPKVAVAGTHFGTFYTPEMLESETLVNYVLEKKHVSITINEYGFRESSPMAEATIVTLGDSFAFGWGVDEKSGWPELVESKTGHAVYNLGIHDASPKQEFNLFEYSLRKYGDLRGIKNVLWMIYEGNDLEDSYSERRPKPASRGKNGLFRDTVVGLAANLPGTIKKQSVIWKLLSGQISYSPVKRDQTNSPFEVDGVTLPHPLFFSDQLGYRLFYKTYVERAQETEAYVQDHPNRKHLDATIQRMADLANEFGFEVTVLLAPTAARLHGPLFDGFPDISHRPFFLDYVASKSESLGFRVMNLYDLLQPYAASELVFFPDDDHFNERGHELVAELVKNQLF